MKKKKISKDMTFAELIALDSEAAGKLAERGLFCGGCPMAQFETIENGAAAHGVDVDKLLEELNEGGSSMDSKGDSALRGDSLTSSMVDSASLEDCESGK